MAREYKMCPPNIVKTYNEPGVSWREAKKQLRQHYLDLAAAVRGMRESDALSPEQFIQVVEEEQE